MINGSRLLAISRRQRYGVLFVLFLLALSTILITACGDSEETSEQARPWDDPKYADWAWYTWENVKIFHPPDHLHMDQFKGMCQNYISSIDQVSQMLAMNTPKDTLILFYYTGFGQGREMTGRDYPFLSDNVIHFWLPSFPGPTMMDWLIPKWVSGKASYPFLRHGLRALFDFSGQNYHQGTFNNLRDSDYVPLSRLPSDPYINSDTERVQSAEAASFVAYVLAQYGALRLRTMYRYGQPFDVMVRDVFQVPVDTLEQDWLDFAWQFLPDSVKNEQYRAMGRPDEIPIRSQEE